MSSRQKHPLAVDPDRPAKRQQNALVSANHHAANHQEVASAAGLSQSLPGGKEQKFKDDRLDRLQRALEDSVSRYAEDWSPDAELLRRVEALESWGAIHSAANDRLHVQNQLLERQIESIRAEKKTAINQLRENERIHHASLAQTRNELSKAQDKIASLTESLDQARETSSRMSRDLIDTKQQLLNEMKKVRDAFEEIGDLRLERAMETARNILAHYGPDEWVEDFLDQVQQD
ncbi:hypothetical protein FSST1_002470 [Fusarium sambucinum]